MEKNYILLLLVSLIFHGFGFSQPDFHHIASKLGSKDLQHPYLIFNNEDKPAILKRINEDRQAGEIMDRLLAEGRRYLYAPVMPEAPTREIHTRYVGEDVFRRYIDYHRNAALVLGFLYQMTGDESYAHKAYEYSEKFCQVESWVNSAHYFDVIYPRVWPFNVKDDQVVFTYDISASTFTMDVALIYDWIYPVLTKAQRDRIRGALLEKAILRVRGNYDYFWWSTASRCNWSGVCYSGLGLASLALLKEDPQLTDVVEKSCSGLWNMLDCLGEDGSWQEGRGYWAYGLGNSMLFIDAVKRITDGKINFFKHKNITGAPLDFALYGLTAGFGDGSGYPVGSSHMINKLVSETGDGQGAWYRDNFINPGSGMLDLLWPAADVKAEIPRKGSKIFKHVDWAILRNGFGEESVTVSCKAGMNDDPHHGHMDCGSFNLVWQNLDFICEARGASGYDEMFFGDMRWSYPQASTKGHNVVLVNGEEQMIAKEKDKPWKENVGGKIIQHAFNDAWDYVKMDPTKAYPGKELKSWRRWLILDKENNIVVALDNVQCARGSEIELRFHSGVEYEVADDKVILKPQTRSDLPAKSRGGRMQIPSRAPSLSGMEAIGLYDGEFAMAEGRQAYLPVVKDASVSWIPYFSGIAKAARENNFIATVFYPEQLTRNGKPQFTLDEKGASPAVGYTVGGKKIKYVFNEDQVVRLAE